MRVSGFSFPVSRNEKRQRGSCLLCACRFVLDVIRPRICAEECMSDVEHSDSTSREGTRDHRSCHRRFSRRVTTAEPVVPCPGPPPTQGCRLNTEYEQMIVSSRAALPEGGPAGTMQGAGAIACASSRIPRLRLGEGRDASRMTSIWGKKSMSHHLCYANGLSRQLIGGADA